MQTRALIALVVALPLVAGCSEMVAPAQAQSAELAQIEALLSTVLERLDTLEARNAARAAAVADSLGSLGLAIDAIAVDVGGGVGIGAGIGAQLEGSLCTKFAWQADASFSSTMELRGKGDAMAGVSALSTGAEGELNAIAATKVSIVPQGGAATEAQVCAKLVGTAGIDASAGVGVTIGATDPVLTLLDDFMRSVGTGRLTSHASARNMSGTRLAQAGDALSSLALDQLPFGQAGAGSLVGALPIPSDLRSLAENPTNVLSEAADAATFAIDRLCGQELSVGQFAAALDAGCTLRGSMPTPAELVTILDGLNGLPGSASSLQSSVSTLEGRMNTACNAMDAIVPARLVIAAQQVTILGTSYTTFPGYNARLFPGLSASC